MKRWHALHTLEIVYRDAFNNQLNDRYQAKLNEYRELSRSARANALLFGIGLVQDPVPKAQQPSLSLTPAASVGGTVYVQISWASGMGKEGAPSDVTAFTVPASNGLTVTPSAPPAVAAGYNVYAGASASGLSLQNGSLIAANQSFVLPATLSTSGNPPGTGQPADVYITGGPLMRRG
jgi:hypothetical protein